MSTAILLAGLISVAARLYVRLRVQNQFTIDDDFLVVPLCCLISAMGVMYSVTTNRMYMMEAMMLKLPGADLPPDLIQQTFHFQKWITVTAMLCLVCDYGREV